jgi:AcrR family transcriptional regulator
MRRTMEEPEQAPADGRLRRGDVTRRAVLKRAVEIASVEGLDGLSIGALAKDLGISKSGVFAHFGAKEELQLATIRAARAIFAKEVVAPALEVSPGLGRVRALVGAWLDYSRGRMFPGGCFFSRATHEYAARPGAVRDALAVVDAEWLDLITRTVEEAQGAGEIRDDVDARQLAFDLDAYLESANLRSLLTGDQAAYATAERSVLARLGEAAAVGAAGPA